MIYNRTCNQTSSEAYQLCFWFWHSMITLDTGSWHRHLIMTPDNDIRHWQLTKAVDNDIWHWQLTRTFGTGSWQWHLTRKEVSKASTMTWWYFTVSSLMLLMNHLKQRAPIQKSLGFEQFRQCHCLQKKLTFLISCFWTFSWSYGRFNICYL